LRYNAKYLFMTEACGHFFFTKLREKTLPEHQVVFALWSSRGINVISTPNVPGQIHRIAALICNEYFFAYLQAIINVISNTNVVRASNHPKENIRSHGDVIVTSSN